MKENGEKEKKEVSWKTVCSTHKKCSEIRYICFLEISFGDERHALATSPPRIKDSCHRAQTTATDICVTLLEVFFLAVINTRQYPNHYFASYRLVNYGYLNVPYNFYLYIL